MYEYTEYFNLLYENSDFIFSSNHLYTCIYILPILYCIYSMTIIENVFQAKYNFKLKLMLTKV